VWRFAAGTLTKRKCVRTPTVKRTFGIIAERISNLSYGEVEASLIIDKGFGAPNLLKNLIPGYGFCPPADQQGENFGGLRLESYGGSIRAKLATSEIQFELREANHNFRSVTTGNLTTFRRTGRQPHTSRQVMEARVGMQGGEAGICVQE
jgi:hypothetical protein